MHAQITRQTQTHARLEWKCLSSSKRMHSKWIDLDQLEIITLIENPNQALGRRAYEPLLTTEFPFINLYFNKKRGRFAVATQPITQGTCAFTSMAFAVIVSTRWRRNYCHFCFSRLVKKAFQCGNCQFALYCSNTCLQNDSPLHDLQCKALEKLQYQSIANQFVDEETIRLALAVLSMEELLQTTTPLGHLYIPKRSHDVQRTIDDAVKWLQYHIRSASVSHIIKTIERIQCNAHPLYIEGSTCVGIGIFPDAAMTLNHSCMPLTFPRFDPITRTLCFHVIDPQGIAPGQVITYSYVSDLMTSRIQRQEILQQGFGFICDCMRCCMDTTSIDPQYQLVFQQLMSEKPIVSKLKQTYQQVLKQHPDLEFAVTMKELKQTIESKEWSHVLVLTNHLISLWKQQGLPICFPTIYLLYQQQFNALQALDNPPQMKIITSILDHLNNMGGWNQVY